MEIKDEKVIVGNVALWFAKNENGETIKIYELDNKYIGKYYCPLCGSEVIPKALESERMASHFAHNDKSKCKGETIVHWWVKNELLKIGEEFEVLTDKRNNYVCKNIEIEKSYKTEFGIYRPDIAIETDCGETVFIEINLSNKKSDDYFDKWEEIGNTVIELNLKDMMHSDNIYINNKFGAIYYKGKRRVIDRNSRSYISYKSSITKSYDKNIVNDLDWFIDDVYEVSLEKQNSNYSKICDGLEIIKCMSEKHKNLVVDIYKSSRCGGVLKEIIKNKTNEDLKNGSIMFDYFIKKDFISIKHDNKIMSKLFESNIYFELNYTNIVLYFYNKYRLDGLITLTNRISGLNNKYYNSKKNFIEFIEKYKKLNYKINNIIDKKCYTYCLKEINYISRKIYKYKEYLTDILKSTNDIDWKNIVLVEEINSNQILNNCLEQYMYKFNKYKKLLSDNDRFNYILSNKDYYKLIDESKIKTKDIKTDLIHTTIKYIDVAELKNEIESICNIVREKIYEFEKMNILYNKLSSKINNIASKNKLELSVDIEDREVISVKILYEKIDEVNDEFYEQAKTKYSKIKITPSNISINDLVLFNIKIDNIEDFEYKLLYCINLCLGKDFVILDDKISEIYFNIRNTYNGYERKTAECYPITCDLNSFYIWKYNDIIGEYKYNKNTTYEDIKKCFSDAIRLNLYGTK